MREVVRKISQWQARVFLISEAHQQGSQSDRDQEYEEGDRSLGEAVGNKATVNKDTALIR
jgi:hypothetical protein